jgi:hypothetical protein
MKAGMLHTARSYRGQDTWMGRGSRETSAPAPMALPVTLTAMHNPRPHPLPTALPHTGGKTQPEESLPSNHPREAPSSNPQATSIYMRIHTKNRSGEARPTPTRHRQGSTTLDCPPPETATTRWCHRPGHTHPTLRASHDLAVETRAALARQQPTRPRQLTVARGEAYLNGPAESPPAHSQDDDRPTDLGPGRDDDGGVEEGICAERRGQGVVAEQRQASVDRQAGAADGGLRCPTRWLPS